MTKIDRNMENTNKICHIGCNIANTRIPMVGTTTSTRVLRSIGPGFFKEGNLRCNNDQMIIITRIAINPPNKVPSPATIEIAIPAPE